MSIKQKLLMFDNHKKKIFMVPVSTNPLKGVQFQKTSEIIRILVISLISPYMSYVRKDLMENPDKISLQETRKGTRIVCVFY